MRKARDWEPYSTLHLMARGIRRTAIFRDEDDYEVFRAILKRVLDRMDCKLHSYCLMTNHFHLLMETGELEVGKVMKYLMNNYARYFNHRYGYRGHLFEGRFVSVVIRSDNYFLEVSRYIHLNPVKAGMVTNPEAYPHSSYHAFIRDDEDGLLTKTLIYGYFRRDPPLQYQRFVEEKLDHREQEIQIQREMREDDQWLPW